MTRTYEASVLSVEPRGDHQLATVRVQSLGTLAVEVGLERTLAVGEVRLLTIEMDLSSLVVAHEEQPADYR